MRFLLDAEQRAFTASLDAMLTAARTPAVIRSWSAGDHGAGRALWSRLADAGVFALAVPEADGGLGPRPVELVVAFVELGRHAVPGPLVETVTAATLLSTGDRARELLPALASGRTTATVAPPAPTDAPTITPDDDTGTGTDTAPAGHAPAPDLYTPALEGNSSTPGANSSTPDANSPTPEAPEANSPTPEGTLPVPEGTPLALDGDAASLRLVVDAEGLRLAPGHGPVRVSLDPARRLTPLSPGGELLTERPPVEEAFALARLATAAQALGVGLALLDRTVAHVRRRTQFGVPIGSFQAVKHRLADAKIALEFARPLLLGAALTRDPVDIAAAKVSACEAAYGTAKAALQLHGAIGYTAEYDLSLWLTKAIALRSAWGTPRECRAVVVRGR
ncbi:acyl-CoA dehydrogenase [Streptomyces griseoviridis]|uniref:Acyl-CoA dehydrogenase n=1 Tax=Streptomyces griseoviridis TaxID=45398 RepID=A0A3S9ZJ98_STRGD|nr:acyl-CoA dehydrogenase family protein [Streptomyces griseoviridis]AZS87857.1 acyl-CoA dehydrogenase [Streptomyces griseoviridis]QCN85299.1 acyl-CoA dehydrogenase [Streptomyces griseoviridis]